VKVWTIVSLLFILAASPAASRSPQLAKANLTSFLAKYGLPSDIARLSNNQQLYGWNFQAKIQRPVGGNGEPTELTCRVTVQSSSDGKIMKVRTNLSSPGARMYASFGGFGKLCDLSRMPFK